MTREARRVALVAIFSMTAVTACGGSGSPPLQGTWVHTDLGPADVGAEELVFDANDTLSITFSYTTFEFMSCTGSDTLSGLTWSATSTTFTLAGTATCTGEMRCGSFGDQFCLGGKPTSLDAAAGTCEYEISNGNDTLTIINGTLSGDYARKL